MAFTEKDKDRLRLYLAKCEEMVNSSFVKNAPKELNLKVDFEEGKITANWPEEESVKSFWRTLGQPTGAPLAAADLFGGPKARFKNLSLQ